MDWLNPREDLTLSLSKDQISPTDKSTKAWRDLRNKTLFKNRHSCRTCGGRYSKYLICYYLDRNPTNSAPENMDSCCRFCYLITHINSGFNDSFVVCVSTLSQKEIVKRTVDLVLKNSVIPTVLEVDPKAKKAPLSVAELCAVLRQPDVMDTTSVKLFFTEVVDSVFLRYYISAKDEKSVAKIKIEMLEDSDSDDSSDDNMLTTSSVEQDLIDDVFSESTKHKLDQMFSRSDIKSEINTTLDMIEDGKLLIESLRQL